MGPWGRIPPWYFPLCQWTSEEVNSTQGPSFSCEHFGRARRIAWCQDPVFGAAGTVWQLNPWFRYVVAGPLSSNHFAVKRVQMQCVVRAGLQLARDDEVNHTFSAPGILSQVWVRSPPCRPQTGSHLLLRNIEKLGKYWPVPVTNQYSLHSGLAKPNMLGSQGFPLSQAKSCAQAFIQSGGALDGWQECWQQWRIRCLNSAVKSTCKKTRHQMIACMHICVYIYNMRVYIYI